MVIIQKSFCTAIDNVRSVLIHQYICQLDTKRALNEPNILGREVDLTELT